MPNPVPPSQFCDSIPSANANFCERFTKWLNVPQLLCDLFSWMFNSDGTVSEEFQAQVALFAVPTGTIMYSLTQNMGNGWLLCDGREVSRTTYAALFDEIGTRYGDGDASTTFNLPDIRGRSPIGAGTGDGLTFRDINAATVGEESHALTEDENGPHTHTYTGPTTRTEERGDGADVVWRGSDTSAEVDSSGSGTPHNTIHPCIIAWCFVKT
jgi:microcystin-dependent protein